MSFANRIENSFLHIPLSCFKDDQDYLIKQAHVGHIIKPEWKNPTRGVQTKDVIKNYFTQLSKTQIDELYEMFRYVYIFLWNLRTFVIFLTKN